MSIRRSSLARALSVAALALLLAPPVRALDPAIPFSQLAHRSWGVEQGLPTNNVRGIAQTPDGYMWLATVAGLARFDGVRFTIFNRSNTPQFRSNVIRSVVVAKDGTLWIATAAGAVRLRNGVFTAFGTEAGLASLDIGGASAGTDGSLVFGSSGGGVVLWKGGRFTSLDIRAHDPANRAMAATHGHDGAIWFGTVGAGLGRYLNGRLVFFRDGLLRNAVTTVYTDRDGTIWAGSDLGVTSYRNGKFTSYSLAHGIPGFVTSFAQDRDGALWIGTRGGLVRHRAGRLETFTTADGLSDTGITSVFIDRENTLWIGTAHAGVHQVREATFRVLTTRDGLARNATLCVIKDQKGGLWFGHTGGEVTHLQNGRTTRFGVRDGMPDAAIDGLAVDGDGGIWAATMGGAARIFNGKVRRFTTADGLSSNDISGIAVDGAGYVWLSSRSGAVNRFNGTGFKHFGAAQGLANLRNHLVTIDSGGAVLIWNSGGVYRFANGRFSLFLPRSVIEKRVAIAQIVSFVSRRVGRSDSLWFAMPGSGLGHWDGRTITPINTSHGLLDEDLTGLSDDGRGGWWLSSKEGVSYVPIRHTEELVAGKRTRIAARAFGFEDGLRSLECGTGFPDAAFTPDGQIWVATMKGVAVTTPEALRRRKAVPSVNIQSLTVDGRELSAWPREISPGSRRLDIGFTALAWAAPDQSQFRFKLDGFDANWISSSQRRMATYTNLPPGKYRLLVMAANADGVWSEAVASPPLVLLPHFYQTTWFRTVAALLLVVLIASVFHLAVRTHKKRALRLQELIDERTQLLRLANDDLGAANESLIIAKNIAETTARANAQLSHKNALILDSAAEGIFGLSAAGEVTFINRAASELLGWDAAEIISRPLHPLLHALGGGNVPSFEECPVCRPAATHSSSSRVEFRTRRGALIPVEYTSATIHDEDGDDRGVVVTFRDVRERLAVEKMKDEFVSTVSHELRTPLTSIRSALGLLSAGVVGTVPPKAQRMFGVAVRNTDRLIRLVNDILDIERLSSGLVELRPVDVDTADLMRQAGEVMHGLAARSSVTIEVHPVAATIYADPDRMLQILTNLLSNAVKFSRTGSVVRLTGRSEAGSVILEVVDQGRGIPPEKLDLVFERFKQVDASDAREKGGSGLGLPICRSIAEAHHGSITVTSEPGVGSTFSLVLPLAQPAELSAAS